MQTGIKSIDKYWNKIAVFLLAWFTFTITLCAMLFPLGICVSGFQLVLAYFLAVLYIYATDQNEKETTFCAVAALFIFMIFVLFSCSAYDKSWDGAAYHKQAVGLLKEGWNPFFRTAKEYCDLSKGIPAYGENPLFWAEVYPKASWYFAAAVYSIVGNIEAGKVYTILFMFILFGLTYDYMEQKEFKRWQCYLVAFVAACNPFSLDQWQSYYVDGMSASVVMAVMIELLILIDDKIDTNKKHRSYFVLACLIIIGCNLKFSILAYVAIACIIYFAYCIWLNRKNVLSQVKLFLYFASTSLFGICIVGFAPYVTNTIRYKNPLHGFVGLMDASSIDVNFGISGLNRVERTLASLFGKMSHGSYKTLSELLKIPFTYSKDELQYYSYLDLRVSGFGMMFSGILILSLLILAVVYIRNRKCNNKVFWLVFMFGISIILELLVFEVNYQERYIGHLYVLVLFAVTFVLMELNREKKSNIYYKLLLIIVVVLVFINNAPWIRVTYEREQESLTTREELRLLGERVQEENIQDLSVAFYCYDFNGLHYNLKDNGITDYKYIDYSEIDETYKSTYGNWILYNNERE